MTDASGRVATDPPFGIDDRLRHRGIVLPRPSQAAGQYVNALVNGSQLFISGHGPTDETGVRCQGRVPREVSVEDAVQAARLTALNCVSTAAAVLTDLDRVVQVLRVFGMVNAEPGFDQHIQIIDGASQLFVEVFGDRGLHTRAAVGMSSLPMNISVELEVLMAVKP